jgi:hypothetical protein
VKYLVFCMCGHGLDRHAAEGCDGDGRMPCPCPNDQERALDSAIEHARRHPWGAAQTATESEIA